MNYPLFDDILLVRGDHSFFLVAKVKEPFALCIETFSEEYCQGVSAGELVVVSAPEGGAVQPALILLELVRTYHIPLLVLPKDHPGSKRISYVTSVGPEIKTDCSIRRGTHPEQHLICSARELSGIRLSGSSKGIDITPFPESLRVERVNSPLI